jgi:hypothetical protein
MMCSCRAVWATALVILVGLACVTLLVTIAPTCNRAETSSINIPQAGAMAMPTKPPKWLPAASPAERPCDEMLQRGEPRLTRTPEIVKAARVEAKFERLMAAESQRHR